MSKLNERVIEIAAPWKAGLDIRVVTNPSRSQIINLVKQHEAVRGLEYSGKVFVWPAAEATHYTVRMALTSVGEIVEDSTVRFMLFCDRDTYSKSYDGEYSIGGDVVLLISGGLSSTLRKYAHLNEAKLMSVAEINCPIWHNPTKSDLIALGSKQDLRGLLLKDEIYVWPAMEAIHGEMRDYLRLDNWAGSFYVRSPNYNPQSASDISEWTRYGVPFGTMNGIQIYVDKYTQYKFYESPRFMKMAGQRDKIPA